MRDVQCFFLGFVALTSLIQGVLIIQVSGRSLGSLVKFLSSEVPFGSETNCMEIVPFIRFEFAAS